MNATKNSAFDMNMVNLKKEKIIFVFTRVEEVPYAMPNHFDAAFHNLDRKFILKSIHRSNFCLMANEIKM